MIILSFPCYSIITRYMAFEKDETINRKNKLINSCFLFYLILYGFECDQTGIAMGPSILGKFSALAATIYPRKNLYLIKTLGNFACLLYMFLVGVKMDLSMVTKSGKALVIGLCAFLLSLTLSTIFASILKHNVTMEQNLCKSLILIAVFQSTSSFHVIACLLADLNLLNPELGRLTTSSSMVSGICSWIWLMISLMVRQSSIIKKNTIPFQLLGVASMLFIIICIMRPILLWMTGHS